MLGHNRRMTGAECLADMLEGLRRHPRVHGAGRAAADLRRDGDGAPAIARIHTHGEKSAAYMADGYARASGKPGICMAQVIGALNLAAGLRDAWLAHSPVIAMTGGREPKTKFRKVYQEIDDMPAFEPVTKFNATVDDVARFPDMVRQAFRVGDLGHARARCICSSAATKARSTSTRPRWSRWSSRSSRACRRSGRQPDDASVRAALELLQEARAAGDRRRRRRARLGRGAPN